jgi:hypothetical protein
LQSRNRSETKKTELKAQYFHPFEGKMARRNASFVHTEIHQEYFGNGGFLSNSYNQIAQILERGGIYKQTST